MGVSLILLLLVGSFPACAQGQTREELIYGEWQTVSGDELVAYFFFPDGTFYFVNQAGSNSGFRYFGSSGSWKLSYDTVSIRVSKHYFWRDPPKRVSAETMGYDYGKANLLMYLIADSPWRAVGSMSDYFSAYAAFGADRSMPAPRAKFAVIAGGRLRGSEQFLMPRSLAALGVEQRILDNLERAQQAKAGAWSPEG
jgi:hypothetical protein